MIMAAIETLGKVGNNVADARAEFMELKGSYDARYEAAKEKGASGWEAFGAAIIAIGGWGWRECCGWRPRSWGIR